MSRERVKEYLKKYNMDNRIITVEGISATVKEAAEALGTKEERIAKTLSFKLKDKYIVVAPQAGNTVSNCFNDSSRYTSTPSFNANGHTPPIGCPIFSSTSSELTIWAFSPNVCLYLAFVVS